MHTLQVPSNFNRVATATTETQFKFKGENQQVGIQIPIDRFILNNLFNVLIRESFFDNYNRHCNISVLSGSRSM